MSKEGDCQSDELMKINGLGIINLTRVNAITFYVDRSKYVILSNETPSDLMDTVENRRRN